MKTMSKAVFVLVMLFSTSIFAAETPAPVTPVVSDVVVETVEAAPVVVETILASPVPTIVAGPSQVQTLVQQIINRFDKTDRKIDGLTNTVDGMKVTLNKVADDIAYNERIVKCKDLYWWEKIGAESCVITSVKGYVDPDASE
jgi:hypothetical protein